MATRPGSGRRLGALHRALPLLRPGHTLRFATLPTGEDPDSLIRFGGRPAFEQVIAAARPLSDMLWESEVRGGPARHPGEAGKDPKPLAGHVQKIADRRSSRNSRPCSKGDAIRGRLNASARSETAIGARKARRHRRGRRRGGSAKSCSASCFGFRHCSTKSWRASLRSKFPSRRLQSSAARF